MYSLPHSIQRFATFSTAQHSTVQHSTAQHIIEGSFNIKTVLIQLQQSSTISIEFFHIFILSSLSLSSLTKTFSVVFLYYFTFFTLRFLYTVLFFHSTYPYWKIISKLSGSNLIVTPFYNCVSTGLSYFFFQNSICQFNVLKRMQNALEESVGIFPITHCL